MSDAIRAKIIEIRLRLSQAGDIIVAERIEIAAMADIPYGVAVSAVFRLDFGRALA